MTIGHDGSVGRDPERVGEGDERSEVLRRLSSFPQRRPLGAKVCGNDTRYSVCVLSAREKAVGSSDDRAGGKEEDVIWATYADMQGV
jgi:hypothetical protein